MVQSYRPANKTSAVAVNDISEETVVNRANASITQRLEGQVAGVEIAYSKGQPGASAEVSIRGASSIDGKEPLYIIDGVPMTMAQFKALSPNDIQELSILMDAAATSVYGSRGANGVVVISTKKGVSAQDIVNEAMALQNVQVRKNLDETAFFLPEIYTDKDGNLKFSFTSPEALTLALPPVAASKV